MRALAVRISLVLLLTLGWAGVSQAELTMFWRAEGTTLDEAGNNDYALGDATATAQATPAINTTAVKIGTNGIHINGNGEYYWFTLAEDFVTPNAGAVGFWIKWVTFDATGSAWFSFRGDTFNNRYRGRGISTDELRFRSENATPANSDYDTTDANIATGNWYFVCYAWTDSANTRKIYVWDSAGAAVGSSPFIDSTTNYNAPLELTGASAQMQFGESANTGTTEYYMDNIFVGNSGDDCPTFHTNRDITAYSSYSAGGAAAAPRGLLLGVYP